MSVSFANRHIGPRENQIQEMLSDLGFSSLEELSAAVIPENILSDFSTGILTAMSEPETLERLKQLADENIVFTSFIGMGYYGTIVPSV